MRHSLPEVKSCAVSQVVQTPDSKSPAPGKVAPPEEDGLVQMVAPEFSLESSGDVWDSQLLGAGGRQEDHRSQPSRNTREGVSI